MTEKQDAYRAIVPSQSYRLHYRVYKCHRFAVRARMLVATRSLLIELRKGNPDFFDVATAYQDARSSGPFVQQEPQTESLDARPVPEAEAFLKAVIADRTYTIELPKPAPSATSTPAVQ